MTLRRYQRITEVLSKRQPDLSILAEDVYKPHNLSAMLRSCDAIGVATAHAVHPTGGIPTYNDTSGSAEKWVKLVVHPSIEQAVAKLRSQNMTLYAAHLSQEALDYRDVDYSKPCCIVFGNEKAGVSAEAATLVDQHIIIPMMGMVESLNVSVATAVILFEAQRQRREAGLYNRPRYTPEELNTRAFKWLYPREAAQLKEQGKAYPTIIPEQLSE